MVITAICAFNRHPNLRKMRHRKVDPKKGSWTSTAMDTAMSDVITNSMAYKTAAKLHKVNVMSLKRRVRAARVRAVQEPSCSCCYANKNFHAECITMVNRAYIMPWRYHLMLTEPNDVYWINHFIIERHSAQNCCVF